MTVVNEDALNEIGQKLWLVDFMSKYIGDTGVDFADNEGGDDDTYQRWADELFDRYEPLKIAVKELKEAMLLLGVEVADAIADGYANADGIARARGSANSLLASVQQQISKQRNCRT